MIQAGKLKKIVVKNIEQQDKEGSKEREKQ